VYSGRKGPDASVLMEEFIKEESEEEEILTEFHLLPHTDQNGPETRYARMAQFFLLSFKAQLLGKMLKKFEEWSKVCGRDAEPEPAPMFDFMEGGAEADFPPLGAGAGKIDRLRVSLVCDHICNVITSFVEPEQKSGKKIGVEGEHIWKI